MHTRLLPAIAMLAVIGSASGCSGEVLGSHDGGRDALPDGGDALADAALPVDADAALPLDAEVDAPACIPSRGACTSGGTACCTGQVCGTTTLGQVCCGNAGAPCVTANGEDCCGALECVDGQCVDPTAGAPTCIASRGACTPGGTACCTGQVCGTTTLGQVCCGNAGTPCVTANGEDCCGALECVNGECADPAAACLHATEHCTGGGCCSGLVCGTTTLGQVCCGETGAPCATADGSDCCGALECVGGRCGGTTGGTGPCGYLQWWNSAITYQWMSGLGWDTDLSVRDRTPVVLRHASTLVLYWNNPMNAGYMPRFQDTVTGEVFQFFHLHPTSPLATTVGRTYPAGFVVGYSGGGTADTGYPVYSSGPHLCVQTVATYRTAFPAGTDACQTP